MSFILDALKKAESERSRNAGPVLMDVRIAQSRQRLPVWAWILGCVLLANLALLAFLFMRKPAAVSAQPVAVVVPAAAASAATSPAPAPAPTAVTPTVTAPAVILEPVLQLAPPGLPAPVPAPVVTPAPAAPAPAPLLPRIDNLPTWQDLVAQGVSLPTPQLTLHVYDEVPANRYVLLNSRRLREGDELADGIRVESIVPRGIVLNARGRRFVLLAGG